MDDYEYEHKDIPIGVEVAAHRFAAACARDGIEYASVTVSGKAVSNVTIGNIDETRTFFLMDGGWFELVKIGGAES